MLVNKFVFQVGVCQYRLGLIQGVPPYNSLDNQYLADTGYATLVDKLYPFEVKLEARKRLDILYPPKKPLNGNPIDVTIAYGRHTMDFLKEDSSYRLMQLNLAMKDLHLLPMT